MTLVSLQNSQARPHFFLPTEAGTPVVVAAGLQEGFAGTRKGRRGIERGENFERKKLGKGKQESKDERQG